ncbi:hypothetical protein B0H17DRAFT_1140623 [Mycena rosella]|uniref:Uncharacterized protein n=1 Tax=Mycena rosella TaxID=1033263 RepID=A0AAD7G796_MYCRO|nr:hypothetical protein B0H17DRAFT_1140623 [Mycena rosella]
MNGVGGSRMRRRRPHVLMPSSKCSLDITSLFFHRQHIPRILTHPAHLLPLDVFLTASGASGRLLNFSSFSFNLDSAPPINRHLSSKASFGTRFSGPAVPPASCRPRYFFGLFSILTCRLPSTTPTPPAMDDTTSPKGPPQIFTASPPRDVRVNSAESPISDTPSSPLSDVPGSPTTYTSPALKSTPIDINLTPFKDTSGDLEFRPLYPNIDGLDMSGYSEQDMGPDADAEVDGEGSADEFDIEGINEALNLQRRIGAVKTVADITAAVGKELMESRIPTYVALGVPKQSTSAVFPARTFPTRRPALAFPSRRSHETSDADDDEEIDELDSSQPPTPVRPFPAAYSTSLVDPGYGTSVDNSPAHFGHVCTLFGDDDPDSPTPWRAGEEVQVGGGREATPPDFISPSRLRTTIIATPNATPASKNAAVRRRQLDGSPIPFPDFAAGVNSRANSGALGDRMRRHVGLQPAADAPQTPLRALSSMAPPPPPLASTSSKRSCLAPHLLRPPLSMSRPPPSLLAGSLPNVLAPSLFIPPPLPFPVSKPQQHKKRSKASSPVTPPSALGTAPPAAPPVPSAQPLPPPPVVSERNGPRRGRSATTMLPVVPSCRDPELSAMQIEPTVHFSTVYGAGGAPLGHAFTGADGKDDAVRLVPLTAMHFKPPSPPSPVESAQSLPTEPASLTAISTGDLDLDMNFGFTMGGADTDIGDTDFLMVDTEDAGPADAAFNSPNPASAAKPNAIPIDTGGRPRLAASKAVKEGCQRMLQVAMETAIASGLPEARIIKVFRAELKRVQEPGVDLKAPKLGRWNRYQSYANHRENRVHEHQRINVDYVCDDDEEPLPLDNDELLESYSQFLKFCEDDGINPDLIFDLADELDDADGPQTIGARQRAFVKRMDIYEACLHDDAKKHGWYSLLVTTGSHINEDTNLARVVITGGLGNGAPPSASELKQTVLAAVEASSDVPEVEGSEVPEVPEAPKASSSKVKSDSAPHRDKHAKHVFGINKMREDMSDASKADVGISIFYDVLGGRNFAFRSLVDVCPKGYRLLGWPTGAQLPFLCSADKGISAFRDAEIAAIFEALKARNTPETGGATSTGLRIEKCPYSDGDYIIFTHDYSKPTPKGPPSDLAVIKHWRASGGVALPVLDGEGDMWEVQFDLDDSMATAKTRKQIETQFPNRKPKKEEEEEVVPRRARSKGKLKSKAAPPIADNDSVEEEEVVVPAAAPSRQARHTKKVSPLAPPTHTAAEVPPRTRSRVQRGGGPSRSGHPQPQLKSALRGTAAPGRKQVRIESDADDSDDVRDTIPCRTTPHIRTRCTSREEEDDRPPKRFKGSTSAASHAAVPARASSRSNAIASSSTGRIPPPSASMAPVPPPAALPADPAEQALPPAMETLVASLSMLSPDMIRGLAAVLQQAAAAQPTAPAP